jgi:hypothetical protein
MRQFRLPPVWSWNQQFSQEDQAVFNNPLYVMKCKSQMNGPNKDILNGSLSPGIVAEVAIHSQEITRKQEPKKILINKVKLLM